MGKKFSQKSSACRPWESCVKVMWKLFALILFVHDVLFGFFYENFLLFSSLQQKHGWSTFIPWFHFTLNCHSRMQTTNRYIVSSPSCHPQTKRLRASPPMFSMCDLALEIWDEVHQSNPWRNCAPFRALEEPNKHSEIVIYIYRLLLCCFWLAR
jgi:hypothetical protein